MSKKNKDFFSEKKSWSKVKDELLGCYLKPYVSKILHTGKPLIYIDCFAGKGKFDDGNPGSPLIALEIMDSVLVSSTIKEEKRQIGAAFIDLKYAEDLRTNLTNYPGLKIVSGNYVETIDDLLKDKDGCNLFLYIDPYGIKDLDFSKFEEFNCGRFNSVELLINMNSFGFVREACRALGDRFSLEDDTFFDDLIESNPTSLNASDKSIETLNRIAGGDYWISIIQQLINNQIDGYQAEEIFSERYCQRLRQTFKYVLNMPIRLKKGQHSKYRMIHATNHPDGCVLMADNICNRWELMKSIQTGGQLSFFKETVDNQIIDESILRSHVINYFSQFYSWISLNEALALFFVDCGVVCKSGEVRKILKELEINNWLKVKRDPSLTPKGKPSTFMTEGNGKTVHLKWVKE